jgi:hypothetical protein
MDRATATLHAKNARGTEKYCCDRGNQKQHVTTHNTKQKHHISVQIISYLIIVLGTIRSLNQFGHALIRLAHNMNVFNVAKNQITPGVIVDGFSAFAGDLIACV